MKKIILLSLFLITSATGQNGGSIISRFGIGELNSIVSAPQRAMGNVSIPIASNTDINSLNPAAWASINGLRLQGDILYEHESYSKTSDYTHSSVDIKGLQFAIPIEDNFRIRLLTGFLPLSRVAYKIQTRDKIDDEPYTTDYEGKGGISMFRVGAAFKPVSFLQIGAAYQYYFGTIDQDWNVVFDNANYFGTWETRSTSHKGSGFVFGALFTGIDHLSIGGVLSTAAELSAARNYRVQYSTNEEFITGSSGIQNIPVSIGFGLSYMLSSHIMVASDFTYQDWTDATVFDQKQNILHQAYRIGAGLEWLPSEDKESSDVFSQITYRFGFYQQSTYVHLNNEKPNEYIITAGLGFPFYGQNRGDIALEYGWRGSEDHILGKSSLFRLSFSFNVGESWFIRRTRD